MNKKDFQDGDVVSFLDTPYTRTLGSSHGTVVYAEHTLGVLVRLGYTRKGMSSGTLYQNSEGVYCHKHAYFFANDIQCVKVE